MGFTVNEKQVFVIWMEKNGDKKGKNIEKDRVFYQGFDKKLFSKSIDYSIVKYFVFF